jgi:hypothetical protein
MQWKQHKASIRKTIQLNVLRQLGIHRMKNGCNPAIEERTQSSNTAAQRTFVFPTAWS